MTMSLLVYACLSLSLAYTCNAFTTGAGSWRAERRVNFHRQRGSTDDYVQSLKTTLLRIAARTNRGEIASDSQVESALDIVTQLESMNPTYSGELEGSKTSIEGTWDLVFTDAQLFESSPVFMTIRELYGKNTEKVDQLFQLHRAATNTGEIGSVQQVITTTELISKVSVRNGLIPGAPFSLRGEIVSTADLTIIDRYSMKLSMRETSVKNSNIPFVGSMLAVASLPVGQLLKTVTGNLPECTLSTFYLDGDMRITRNKDDNVFVYLRDTTEST